MAGVFSISRVVVGVRRVVTGVNRVVLGVNRAVTGANRVMTGASRVVVGRCSSYVVISMDFVGAVIVLLSLIKALEGVIFSKIFCHVCVFY